MRSPKDRIERIFSTRNRWVLWGFGCYWEGDSFADLRFHRSLVTPNYLNVFKRKPFRKKRSVSVNPELNEKNPELLKGTCADRVLA